MSQYVTRNGVSIPSYAYPLLKDYVSQYDAAGGKNFTVRFTEETIVETLTLLRKEKNGRRYGYWDEYDDWDQFEHQFQYDMHLREPDSRNVHQDYHTKIVIKYIWDHVKDGFNIVEKQSAHHSKLNGTQKYSLLLLWFVVLSPVTNAIAFGSFSDSLLAQIIMVVSGIIGLIFLISFSLLVVGISLKNFGKIIKYKLFTLDRVPLKTKNNHAEILSFLLQENPYQKK